MEHTYITYIHSEAYNLVTLSPPATVASCHTQQRGTLTIITWTVVSPRIDMLGDRGPHLMQERFQDPCYLLHHETPLVQSQ